MLMEKLKKRIRKPGARARWCPACRRIRPKGKPRGLPFTSARGRVIALAAAARRRREAQRGQ